MSQAHPTWGGARPNSGRKSNAELERIKSLLDVTATDQDWINGFSQLVHMAQTETNPRTRLAAFRLLLEYNFGKPPSVIEHYTYTTIVNHHDAPETTDTPEPESAVTYTPSESQPNSHTPARDPLPESTNTPLPKPAPFSLAPNPSSIPASSPSASSPSASSPSASSPSASSPSANDHTAPPPQSHPGPKVLRAERRRAALQAKKANKHNRATQAKLEKT